MRRACPVSPLARRGVWLALAALVLDQVSKVWILGEMGHTPRVIPVTPFFNLVFTLNRGVSFGLFNQDSSLGPWLLTLLALTVVVLLGRWLMQVESALLATGLGLIMGGALGNVVDRVRFGAVVDFLDVYVGAWHWPAFNVADSAISVGVVLILIDGLFPRPEMS